MRAQLVISALLLTACATSVQVRGRYAAALSSADVQQIRRVAHVSPQLGHTDITLYAVQHDRVRVESRRQLGAGSDILSMYVVRRGAQWEIDHNLPLSVEGERTFTAY